MKTAILLVFPHPTLVLLGADHLYLEENRYTTYKVFFICVFCLNVPSVTYQLQSRKKRQSLLVFHYK